VLLLKIFRQALDEAKFYLIHSYKGLATERYRMDQKLPENLERRRGEADMKKIFAISAGILLWVVVAIGAAYATSYDFNLFGVDKASSVWIYDGKNDDGLTSVIKNSSVTQRVRPNLAIGNERVAKWNFGEKVQPPQLPEAGTLVLLGMGLMGVSFLTRRRFKTN
jgi:hypothetical protein